MTSSFGSSTEFPRVRPGIIQYGLAERFGGMRVPCCRIDFRPVRLSWHTKISFNRVSIVNLLKVLETLLKLNKPRNFEASPREGH